MTVGQRAAQHIMEEAEKNGISVEVEYSDMDISKRIFESWKKGECNPSAKFLQKMAFKDYDIMWILMGDEDEK